MITRPKQIYVVDDNAELQTGCTKDYIEQPTDNTVSNTNTIDNNYRSLINVFNDAFNDATIGKGKERHSENIPIEKQLTLFIEKHDLGFLRGQAVKKIFESMRLEKERAIKELIGAINYLAFKVISMRNEEQ